MKKKEHYKKNYAVLNLHIIDNNKIMLIYSNIMNKQ